jgi:hypothetical protein
MKKEILAKRIKVTLLEALIFFYNEGLVTKHSFKKWLKNTDFKVKHMPKAKKGK